MIEKIRQEGHEINWQDHDSIIKFYESNQLFFDNYKLINDQDEIADIIHMKIHYINALNAKKRFSKALNILPQVDDLIEKLDPNSDKYEKFRTDRLFYYGMLKGNLKDFKTSYSTFSKLIKIDPENDLYKNWYLAMKINLQYEYLKYGSILGLIIVLGDIIADLAFGFKLDNRIVLFGWILMLVCWLGPQVYKFLKKKGCLK